MIEQEAINGLKNLFSEHELTLPNTDSLEVLHIAVQALEKQIPKKPDLEGDGYADGHLVYDTWICPNCGVKYEVDYEEYDYCPDCGQHIDWKQEQEVENVLAERNKIIDEFAEKAIERLEDMGCEAWKRDIMAIAEEMKGGE